MFLRFNWHVRHPDHATHVSLRGFKAVGLFLPTQAADDLHSWDEPTLQAVCHVGRHGLLQEYLRRQAELRSDLNVKLPRAMLKIRQATLLLWGER
jgi:hypothetical protein